MHETILDWIKNSNLSADQKLATEKYLEKIQNDEGLKSFQIQRLKDNLKINSRFLNKTVEDLEETVNLLQDSNSQLGNFVKVASHDLKSPLRSIASFSALLNRMLAGKLNEKETEYFEIIESSAKSMYALIDDLLLFTKVNSEKLKIDKVELLSLVTEVITILNYDIENSKAVIKCNFKPVTLECDPIKFKQVLQNLISNSIKFSTYEGNIPHVILDLEETQDQWRFSIKDNGIGIDERFRDAAFMEFNKLNGDSYEGTGVGLSIVQKIIKKHNGEIKIEPTKGPGTTIVFSISKNIQL
jgi:signal transduction histidine kinase